MINTKKQNGFSLLEVLIAITCLAFLMIGVGKITDQSLTTKEIVTQEDREFLTLEMALARLEQDINQIYTPFFYSRQYDPKTDPYNYEKKIEEQFDPNAPFRNHARFAFVSYEGHPVPILKNPEKSDFMFYTVANRRKVKNVKQSQYAWVRYYTVQMEDEDQRSDKDRYTLYRQYEATNLFEDEPDLGNAKAYPILSNITDFSFEFWDPKPKKWVENLKTISNGEYLLRGIKVSFNYIEKNGFEHPIERIFLVNWPDFEPENLAKLYRTQKDRDADLITPPSEANKNQEGGTQ